MFFPWAYTLINASLSIKASMYKWPTKWKKANAGLSVARESGTIICILTQRQAEEWQSLLFSGKKGEGSCMH